MKRKHAFTLIELLVVISIISLLIAILLPALGNARKASRTTQCLARLKQISVAMVGYYADYDGQLPNGANSTFGGYGWSNQLAIYLGAPGGERPFEAHAKPVFHPNNVYTCPEQPEGLFNGNFPSFGANPHLGPTASGAVAQWPSYRIEEYIYPTGKVFVADGLKDKFRTFTFHTDATQTGTTERALAQRHPGQSTNLNFLDGHARNLQSPPLPAVKISNSVGGPWLVKGVKPATF
ncbi:MAG: prepilin-type N-terminal cleavage/methylation domain-containing protein [Phycisphaeraceae bacterium JB051]